MEDFHPQINAAQDKSSKFITFDHRVRGAEGEGLRPHQPDRGLHPVRRTPPISPTTTAPAPSICKVDRDELLQVLVKNYLRSERRYAAKAAPDGAAFQLKQKGRALFWTRVFAPTRASE